MRTLGEGWVTCHDVFVEVANTKQLNGTLSTFDGQSVQRPAPAIELYAAWSRLRAIMSGPDRGAWLTGRLRVSSDGHYSMDYEWDARPVWPSSVGTDGAVQRGRDVERSALLEDLLRYPRRPRMSTDWLADMQSLPAPEFQDGVWPSDMRQMQEDPDWRVIAEGIKQLIGSAVFDDDLDLLEDDEVADGLLQEVLNQVDAGRLRSMVSAIASDSQSDSDRVWTGVELSDNAGQALLDNPQLSPQIDRFRAAIEALVAFERSVVSPGGASRRSEA